MICHSKRRTLLKGVWEQSAEKIWTQKEGKWWEDGKNYVINSLFVLLIKHSEGDQIKNVTFMD